MLYVRSAGTVKKRCLNCKKYGDYLLFYLRGVWMLLLATVLFIAAAILGLSLFAAFIMNKSLAIGTAMIHGMLAEAGLIFVFVQAHSIKYKGVLGLNFLLLLLTAAAGLILVLFFHLKGRKLPRELVISHAVSGVLSLALFVIRVFRGAE